LRDRLAKRLAKDKPGTGQAQEARKTGRGS